FAFAYFARAVNWIGDPGIAAGWTDQAAQYGIVAVPVALLMIGGEFDLSAGVMIGSSGLLLGYLATHVHMNIWPAMALVLLFGLVIGFINGVTVIKTKLPSFIVTLATFFVLQGVNAAGTLKLTGTTAIENIDSASGFNSAHRFFASDLTHYAFKVKVLWWIGLTIVGAWLLAKSRFGNWIYSAGGDPLAARNVGVPVARTKITLFMLTSGTAALMGCSTRESAVARRKRDDDGRGCHQRRAASARSRPAFEVLRERHGAEGHLGSRRRRRGDLPPRRQRRREVELHQDPLGLSS